MLTNYVKYFSTLTRDGVAGRWPESTRRRAPHKPLLLLAVIDLFAEGALSQNLIEVSPELGELFTLYWARVMPPDQRGSLAMPFFYMKSEGFWHLVARQGKAAIVTAMKKITSITELHEFVEGARLDDELYGLLQDQTSRDVLRLTLVEQYFDAERQAALLREGEVHIQAYEYSKALLERALGGIPGVQTADGYQVAARDQGFRRAIIASYDHRCAFCGIRMLTADGHTAVDAAHIVPWSVSHNDDPRNGMALCRLCHWSFDEGLFGVSARFVLILSPQVTAPHNSPEHLITLQERKITGPEEQALWPALESLEWHREKVFRRR